MQLRAKEINTNNLMSPFTLEKEDKVNTLKDVVKFRL